MGGAERSGKAGPGPAGSAIRPTGAEIHGQALKGRRFRDRLERYLASAISVEIACRSRSRAGVRQLT